MILDYDGYYAKLIEHIAKYILLELLVLAGLGASVFFLEIF